VNEKDTDGQQDCPREENPRDSTFRFLAECNPRLQSTKQQGEIAKIDHVDVSIDLGAAVFEKGPDIRQVHSNGGTIAGECRVRGGGQTGPNASRILVQHKYREDVTEDHAGDNEGDSAKQKQAPRTQS
jgi:hypothetical protein